MTRRALFQLIAAAIVGRRIPGARFPVPRIPNGTVHSWRTGDGAIWSNDCSGAHLSIDALATALKDWEKMARPRSYTPVRLTVNAKLPSDARYWRGAFGSAGV